MKFFVDDCDQRNKFVKSNLLKNGFETFSATKLLKAQPGDFLVFSPAKKWTEKELETLPPKTKLFCGNIPGNLKEILIKKQIKHTNFLEDELFAIKNAKLTAEGVLALVLTHSPKSIFENKILIFGFGRISKALALIFSKLGLNFKIASFSKESFQESFFAKNENFFGFDFLEKIDTFDIFINTRPVKFLDKKTLEKIPENSLFFETASVNCLDEENAKNFSYINAPALPQKFCAESAGKVLLDKILGELKT